MTDETSARPRQRVPRALRELVYARSAGVCQRDGKTQISLESFHVSHLRAHANGGALVAENLEAWCSRCNLDQRATDVRDTRINPRAWQIEALDPVVAQIVATGAATVSAAPGAGKTVFAGLVFEALREADIVDRLVVVAPRLTIVDQWVDSLKHACHLELKPLSAIERKGQDGVVITYHSLTDDRLAVHRLMQERQRTLLVLDEVHHVGEPGRTAWARQITELAGTVDPPNLRVAGVLNLSGTLWRSNKSERISTVRYEPTDDGRVVSVVDFKVEPELLIGQGQLRPVDLYRLDGKVTVEDWSTLDAVETTMADLDEDVAGAALRAIAENESYRARFIASVLDRLEEIHRSLGRYHSKALIVASNQKDARLFRDEVNAQMLARGLSPFAEIAVSDDGPAAKKVLDSFRKSKRVGVLCTVDMAGEGYDCPDIAVVGYATNKRTAMYVRQVVARAMRVTQRERELEIVPAKVVVPDVEDLVARFLELLTPILSEIAQPPDRPTDGLDPDAPSGGLWGPRYRVTDLEPVDEHVSVALSEDEVYDFPIDDVTDMARELEAANLMPAIAPRVLVAMRRYQESRPFDDGQRIGVSRASSSGVSGAQAPAQALPTSRAISIEDHSRRLQEDLHRAEGWWKFNGDERVPIATFVAQMNEAGGIQSRGRPTASPDQLQRALDYARIVIRAHCNKTGAKVPRWL